MSAVKVLGAVLALILFALPLAADSQPTGKPVRIAYLGYEAAPSEFEKSAWKIGTGFQLLRP